MIHRLWVWITVVYIGKTDKLASIAADEKLRVCGA